MGLTHRICQLNGQLTDHFRWISDVAAWAPWRMHFLCKLIFLHLLLLHSLYALRAAAIVVVTAVVVVQQPIVISYDGWCLKLFKYIQLI